MKPYKLYLFDLDGTLIDSDMMLISTLRELFAIYRPGYNPSDDYLRKYSGPQITETIKIEFPGLNHEEIFNKYTLFSKKYYEKYVHLYEGVKELLNAMHNKDMSFAVITNKHSHATEYVYKLFDLDNLNIFSICADNVEHLKPAPDGIYKAMKQFGVSNKEDVIYIGDGQGDYETAKNAGVDFGYVSWSPRKLSKDAKIEVVIDNYKIFAEEIGL